MVETNNTALLSCPFCGEQASAEGKVTYSESFARREGWDQSEFYYCNCPRCGVDNKGIVGHRTKADAIAAWNRRSPTDTSQTPATPNRSAGDGADVSAGGWQDISTAPKDGTHVLVSLWGWNDPSSGERVTTIASYGPPGCWREVHGGDPAEKLYSPTHWRPLPPPPASGARP